MFLQAAFYISLYLFAASIIAAPSPNPGFNDSHLPSLRLSREEAQAMEESKSYPPGYVHKNIAFREDSSAITVPVVEADPDILLDDKDGIPVRILDPRDQQCPTPTPPMDGQGCYIIYCWILNNGTVFTEYLNLVPGKNPGKSNPTSLTSSNINHLSMSQRFNDGYNHWFAKDHECSDRDTVISTNHYLANNVFGVASIHYLQCGSCIFQTLYCQSWSGFGRVNNLEGWSSNSGALLYCTFI
jgi:hypothetical protein